MDWLREAGDLRRRLGTREFYVRHGLFVDLVRQVLASSTRPSISMNRPQVGGNGLIHNVEWQGLKFVSVSRRPIVLG